MQKLALFKNRHGSLVGKSNHQITTYSVIAEVQL